MPSLPRSILVLLAFAAVLLAAGCGGGSNRLSETAFRSRANHVCAQLSKQQQSNLASKASLDENVRRLDSAVSRLEGLHPPAGNEQRYGDLLTRFKRSVSFIKTHESQLIELVQRLRLNPSDSQTLARYRRLVRPVTHDVGLASSDASALGLGACARGLSGGSTG